MQYLRAAEYHQEKRTFISHPDQPFTSEYGEFSNNIECVVGFFGLLLMALYVRNAWRTSCT